MTGVRSVPVSERRARLARRQRLAPGHRAADAVEAARSVVGLHATTPSSVYLAAWARVDGFDREAMDAALYRDRTLVKHMAMRRTLFVFPLDVLPAVQAGASARVAAAESSRLVRELERAGVKDDPAAWLEEARAAVLAALRDGRELSSTRLRQELPVLEGGIPFGAGRSWAGTAPLAPRVLTILAAEGRVVRADNDGAWTVSRPLWATTESWLGRPITPLQPQEGVTGLVRHWLHAFGPGTVEDLTWWLGGTKASVRQALHDLGAVEVDLDGRTGHLLPDDVEPVEAVEPWGALLPELDPTTMGWKERDWYLGDHRAQIFDSAGNGGATAWWDGRIVGGWTQDDDGVVVLVLLEDVGSDAEAALRSEADRLTTWLEGTRVVGRFPSPLSRATAP
jgi:hypothetical protein